METQNTEMTLRFLEAGAERPLQRGPTLVKRLNPDAQGLTPANRLQRSHETPPVIAAAQHRYRLRIVRKNAIRSRRGSSGRRLPRARQ